MKKYMQKPLLLGALLTLALGAVRCASTQDGQALQTISGAPQDMAAQPEDGPGPVCTTQAGCPADQECDDGRCKPHGQRGRRDDRDGGTRDDRDGDTRDDRDGDAGPVCTAQTDCPADQECDDGRCKPHGQRGRR